MNKKMRLTAIVAIDRHGGIGINNTLPWRLPEDLAHFKRTTTGHAVIMGRKTFESLGHPLPNRRNIVVTRNASWRHEGVETADSVAQAAALASEGGDSEAFVIGGGQIFAESMPMIEKMIITKIERAFECDAFFPPIDTRQWQEVAREAHHSDANGFDYAFVTYERK